MNQARMRLATVTVVPFALALATNLTVFLALRDRLPDVLATHFGASGVADGTTSPTAMIATAVVLHVAMGTVWAVAGLRGPLSARGMRRLVAGGWAASGFIGYVMTAIVHVNRDATDSAAVRFSPWHLAVAVGVALLAAGAGVLLSRFVPDPEPVPHRVDSARIDLAEGEIAGWAKQARSGALLTAGLLLLVAGVVVTVAGGWWTGPGVGVVGLLVLALASAHVCVDRRGLTVGVALLTWPRVRVPLDTIEAASSRDINAIADFGGWGYRVRHARTGWVLRSGEAIVVRRKNGREFAVTVDDSATAVALLNTLLDRRGRN